VARFCTGQEPKLTQKTELAGSLVLLWLLAFNSTACGPIALTRPVTKLGLVATFEGTQRARGYEALYAAKLALREQNAAGGVSGWQVELVALDQDDQPELMVRQARALAVDPDVTYVIGFATVSETGPLQQQYAALGLPVEFVDPSATADLPLDLAFAEHYRALSNGVQPGALATRVYLAAKSALARIAERVRTQGRPAR
jgi:ABC-type branched-subunit amino acid transport system substrate-binding protein